jgi:hypothetical protein
LRYPRKLGKVYFEDIQAGYWKTRWNGEIFSIVNKMVWKSMKLK